MEEEKIEIPQELMIEVALRLPVKSIGRFKSVSKPCNFFFSSPEFVKSHLHRRIRHAQERIILLDAKGLNPHAITLDTEGGGSSSEVRSRGLTGIVSKLLGCCNGLALFQVTLDFFRFGLFVINPVTSTGTRVPVPFSASADREMWKEWRFGLGYSSLEDDYKIVVLWDTVSLALALARSSRIMSIFSLKTRKWKKLSSFPHLPCSYRPLVYVDGRLHWLAYKGATLVIDAFDLSTEKYEEVSFPAGFECDHERKHRGYVLADMGGCLALLDYDMDVLDILHIDKTIDVWIKEKSADKKMCWRKFTISGYPKNDRFFFGHEVICRLGESEFLLSRIREELVTCNCETGVWRKMDIDGLPEVLASGIFAFRESLASPNSQV